MQRKINTKPKRLCYRQLHIIISVMLGVLLAACSQKSKAPPIDLLAQDARFLIANHVFRLPLVAVSFGGRSYVLTPCARNKIDLQFACTISLDEIAKRNLNTNAPIPITALRISLQQYSSFRDSLADDYIEIPELCEKLSQQWAKTICNYRLSHAGLGTIPRNFSIIEESKSSLLGSGEWCGDAACEGSAAEKIHLNDNNPNFFCGNDENGAPLSLCNVAVRVDENIIAMWIVPRTDTNQISAEAQAIKAFVRFAIGESEDFSALTDALQQTK